MNKTNIILLASAIIICTLYYFFNYKPRKELVDYGRTTNALIVNYSYGSHGKNWITYKYSVNGIEYKGQCAVSSFRCDEENNIRKGCVGMTFKVVYSTRQPKISEISLGRYNKFKLIKL